MADLANAIQNIWSSDYVQKNPTKAYKVSYGSEYNAVAGYINGGVRPNPTNFSKLGKGLIEAEDVRRGAVVTPPPVDPPPVDPPPPAGGSLQPPQAPITVVSGQSIGLNVAGDSPRVYQDYDISDTGDSGVILGGTFSALTTFRRFRLRQIGGSVQGTHGIYVKRNNVLIEDWDAEMRVGDGFTLRRSGITVNRFRSVATYDFACSYFEEDPVGGVVTVKNGTGSSHGGYFMWTGLNPSPGSGIVVQHSIHQKFYFENVHATGGSMWIGRDSNEIGYDGPGVEIHGCTINGQPVTAAHVQNYPVISIS